MFHKVCHMHHYIKSIENVVNTKTPTFNLNQDNPTIKSTLNNMIKIPSDINDL